jgi:hypothetical protein
MIKNAVMLVCATLFIASSAFADQLSGLVRITATGPFKQVTLTRPNEFSGTMLCPGDKAKRIMTLESLVVKVWGSSKEIGSVKCFEIGSFTVLKTPSGKDAVVGVIQQKGGVFQITTEDSRVLKLVDVPDSLKDLVGKKVIADLRSDANLTAGVAQAVYYSEFP